MILIDDIGGNDGVALPALYLFLLGQADLLGEECIQALLLHLVHCTNSFEQLPCGMASPGRFCAAGVKKNDGMDKLTASGSSH